MVLSRIWCIYLFIYLLGCLPISSDKSHHLMCTVMHTLQTETDCLYLFINFESLSLLVRALLRRLHLYNIERIDNASLCASLSVCPSFLDLEIVGLFQMGDWSGLGAHIKNQ
ncbi:unnamed protein product [Camellia sinensis]